jgi:hypothetical protein
MMHHGGVFGRIEQRHTLPLLVYIIDDALSSALLASMEMEDVKIMHLHFSLFGTESGVDSLPGQSLGFIAVTLTEPLFGQNLLFRKIFQDSSVA